MSDRLHALLRGWPGWALLQGFGVLGMYGTWYGRPALAVTCLAGLGVLFAYYCERWMADLDEVRRHRRR